jgi:alkylation response protein AidB-like acyl-CoA dehydrogenase
MATIEETVAGISFALSDEQRALRELAREFAAKEIRPKAAEYDEHATHPADLIAKAHDLGLMNVHLPEELGGPELSHSRACSSARSCRGAAQGSPSRSSRTRSAPRPC